MRVSYDSCGTQQLKHLQEEYDRLRAELPANTEIACELTPVINTANREARFGSDMLSTLIPQHVESVKQIPLLARQRGVLGFERAIVLGHLTLSENSSAKILTTQ
jgi:hypothetical protein